MRKHFLLAAVLLLSSFGAQAVPMFVGSYAVFDGPAWPTNPQVYSAREAAALVFGGSYTDYAISIVDSLDYTTITHTGWYDGWGEHQGMIFNEDYRLDVGGLGYANPGGVGTARSAYVRDGLTDTQRFRNYVWRVDVPEPATGSLFGVGLLALGLLRRRRQGA
jgi:hypothetical protein